MDNNENIYSELYEKYIKEINNKQKVNSFENNYSNDEKYKDDYTDDIHDDYDNKENNTNIPNFVLVFNLSEIPEDFEVVRVRYRQMAKFSHPDAPTGNHDDFLRLDKAYREAKEYYEQLGKNI